MPDLDAQKVDDIGPLLAKAREAIQKRQKSAEDVANEERIKRAVDEHIQKLWPGTTQFGQQYDSDPDGDGTDLEVIHKHRNPVMHEVILSKAGEDSKGELISNLQDWNDECVILSKAQMRPVQQLRHYQEGVTKLAELGKIMETQTAGQGTEWVPTILSRQVIDMVSLQLKVAPLFSSINMISSPQEIPLKTGRSTAYHYNEATSDNPGTYPASSMTTSKITLSAEKLVSRVPVSDEMREDSILPIVPMIREDIAEAHARGIEDALLNGDTTIASPIDTDLTDPMDARTLFDGIRVNMNAGAKIDVDEDGSGTLAVVHLRNCRRAMGVYGVNPANLAWVTSISGAFRLMGFAEVLTLEKYGRAATILNGEIARIDGIPIVVSELSREDLNASGVNDGVTETLTALYCIYKAGGVLGRRRAMVLESERAAGSGVTHLVASQRLDWQKRYAAAQNCFGEVYAINNTGS